MCRNLALAFFLCFAAISGLAQSRIDGKWATDRLASPLTITDAQRKQSVQLEVTIKDANASGTLTIGGLGGRFYTFKDGKVTGNKVQFRTDPPTAPTWTFEIVDDNTMMLYRYPLPVAGNDVRDLISILGWQDQTTPAVQVATGVGSPASIRGIVQDKSKAVVPGVTVTATNVDNGVKITAITNEAGLYGFPNVTPGRYTMTASLRGFETTNVSNLSIGDTQFLQDFTLELPTARVSGNPSVASCSRDGIVWCNLLHRAR